MLLLLLDLTKADIAPVLAPRSLFVSRFSICRRVGNFYVRGSETVTGSDD